MSTNKISIMIIIMGPISSSESALKVTYGNVEGQKNVSPAAGFRPSICKVEDFSEWVPIKTWGKIDYIIYSRERNPGSSQHGIGGGCV